MENLTSKSIEYTDSIQNTEYLVKALVVSAPDELKITNIDEEENKGFIFTISISTQPELPSALLDTATNLIFIVGNDGNNRLGYIEDDNFVEIDENVFTRMLHVNVLQVLMIEGNTGHFKS